MNVKNKKVYAMKILEKNLLKKRGGQTQGKTDSDLDDMIQDMKFLTEMKHINVIRLHEIINDPDSKKVYLVMDYLQGGNLAELLEEADDGLPLEKVRGYFRGLLSAIHYCHEVKKIAHRDIKPENIMLDKYGQVYLTDFGVSEFF